MNHEQQQRDPENQLVLTYALQTELQVTRIIFRIPFRRLRLHIRSHPVNLASSSYWSLLSALYQRSHRDFNNKSQTQTKLVFLSLVSVAINQPSRTWTHHIHDHEDLKLMTKEFGPSVNLGPQNTAHGSSTWLKYWHAIQTTQVSSRKKGKKKNPGSDITKSSSWERSEFEGAISFMVVKHGDKVERELHQTALKWNNAQLKVRSFPSAVKFYRM